MLEKTLESASDSKEIKPVNLKGNQPSILFGRTGAEAPVFWSSDENTRLMRTPDSLEKSLMLGKMEGRGEEGIGG